MPEKRFAQRFEDISDLTVNLDKVVLANWLNQKLHLKFRGGYSVEIGGHVIFGLWDALKERYTLLTETTIINLNAIVLIKWSHDSRENLQATVKLENGVTEYLYWTEADELRRLISAIENETK